MFVDFKNRRIIELVRALRRGVKIVVGGYDPSLAPEAYENMGVDYLVRSEGEVTFRELLRALEQGSGFEAIGGLSYRNGESWAHNPGRPPHRLEDSEIRQPNRDARVLTRELLYTAATRARHSVDLWTTPDVLAATLARSTVRWSGLADALGGQ